MDLLSHTTLRPDQPLTDVDLKLSPSLVLQVSGCLQLACMDLLSHSASHMFSPHYVDLKVSPSW